MVSGGPVPRGSMSRDRSASPYAPGRFGLGCVVHFGSAFPARATVPEIRRAGLDEIGEPSVERPETWLGGCGDLVAEPDQIIKRIPAGVNRPRARAGGHGPAKVYVPAPLLRGNGHPAHVRFDGQWIKWCVHESVPDRASTFVTMAPLNPSSLRMLAASRGMQSMWPPLPADEVPAGQ